MNIFFFPDPFKRREKQTRLSVWDKIIPIVNDAFLNQVQERLNKGDLDSETFFQLTNFKELLERHIGEIYHVH